MPAEQYRLWMTRWLTAASVCSDDKSAIHLWFAETMMREVVMALDDSHWERRALLVWNKLDAHYGALGRQYKARFEPCWYAYKKGKSPRWYGATNEPSVWDVKQPNRNDLHPTMKPVELYRRSIENHTKRGDLVLECFGGSGTTVIASEQLGRKCLVIEIEPRYCQVILDRFEAFTGLKAKKIGSK